MASELVKKAQLMVRNDTKLLSNKNNPFWAGFGSGVDPEMCQWIRWFSEEDFDQIQLNDQQHDLKTLKTVFKDYEEFIPKIEDGIKTLYAAQMAFILILEEVRKIVVY
jgi:hypothetical protein